MAELHQVNTETVYFCDRAKTYCCIVGSYWDDGATLIACEFESGDTVEKLFITEADQLTVVS